MVNVELDLELEVIHFLYRTALKNDTTVDEIINMMLRDYIDNINTEEGD